MADDDIVTGDAIAMELRPASFALRAASAAIDVVATALVAAAGVRLVFIAVPGGDRATMIALVILVLAACLLLLPAVIETISRGRSLGRLALGLRIVRDDGGAIGFRHAFIRALLGILELYLTLGGTAAVVGLLSSRTKRLGDLLAGTYAMHERVRQPPAFALPMPEPLLAWAAIADVGRLPDALSRRIATFLRQAAAMTPAGRDAVARALAAETAPHVHPVPDAPPEAFLAGVAVLRRDREFAALERQSGVIAGLEPVLHRRRGLPDRG